MEDNANRQLSIKLSGDDFYNPDGSLRQDHLKQAYDNSCAGDWELTPFQYSDKETFAVLYNGNCIGTVPQSRYEELRAILDKITHLSVSVREYIPDHGRAAEPSAAKHYQAYLSVDYKAEVSASFSPPAPAAYSPSRQSSEQSLEELFASQEKQLAWLEQQRKTLTFASPEEEADADRRLADLKRSHAETVAQYRKLQAARAQKAGNSSPAAAPQAPAPRKFGHDWLTPLIGILILAAAIAVSAFSRKAPEPPTPLPVVTSDTQLLSVDQIHLHFRDQLNYATNGNSALDVDKDALTVTADLWEPSLTPDALNTALHDRDALNTWHDNVSQIVNISGSMQDYISNHGHGEYAVTVRLVNCEDLGQVFAVAERGALVYDVVEDTPPGGEIPDPTKRVRSTDTSETYGNYVLNLYSKVIHTTDCQYAPQLFEHWRSEYNGMYDELIAGGYRPCKICNPGSN